MAGWEIFYQEQPFTCLQHLDPEEEDVELAESLFNDAEYSRKKISTNVRVPDRLCKEGRFGDSYEDVLKADAETVSIVWYGYIVPFVQTPPLAQDIRNNKSCRNMKEFAWMELLRLEKLKWWVLWLSHRESCVWRDYILPVDGSILGSVGCCVYFHKFFILL